jgi:hypothetical protein
MSVVEEVEWWECYQLVDKIIVLWEVDKIVDNKSI